MPWWISNEPIDVSFTSAEEEEKDEFAGDVNSGAGSSDDKHKDEMREAGGRFLTSFQYFKEEHPDFSFYQFYSDLDSYVDGGAEAVLLCFWA